MQRTPAQYQAAIAVRDREINALRCAVEMLTTPDGGNALNAAAFARQAARGIPADSPGISARMLETAAVLQQAGDRARHEHDAAKAQVA